MKEIDKIDREEVILKVWLFVSSILGFIALYFESDFFPVIVILQLSTIGIADMFLKRKINKGVVY